VEGWRKLVLGAPEPVEELSDPVKAKAVASGRKPRQPIELRLDGRIVRPCEVRHQAAFFFFSGLR
jgi:hypothetical protein